MKFGSPGKPRSCSSCGCTDADCRVCIRRTGRPCSWVTPNLCSACKAKPLAEIEIIPLRLMAMPSDGQVYRVLNRPFERLAITSWIGHEVCLRLPKPWKDAGHHLGRLAIVGTAINRAIAVAKRNIVRRNLLAGEVPRMISLCEYIEP